MPRRYARLPDCCTVEGCQKTPKARGWCDSHYTKAMKWGDPLYVFAPARKDGCSIEGCDRPWKKRDWCDPHYLRWYKTGNPLGKSGKPAVTNRRVSYDDGTFDCTACLRRLNASAFGGRHAECRECLAERARRLRQSDPVRARESRQRADGVRRAAKLGARSDTGITVLGLEVLHGVKCAYCDTAMDFAPQTRRRNPLMATIEHVVPLSKGGTHTWDNVVLACLQCNMSKNASDLEDWLARRVA